MDHMSNSKPRGSFKLFFLALTAFAGFALFLATAGRQANVRASASGPTPGHTNAPGEGNCTACHTDFPVDSGVGDIEILGIPANYLPGQQVPVSVRLIEPDGVTWGFQFTAIGPAGSSVGTYTIPAEETGNLQIDSTVIGGSPRTYIMQTVNGVTSPVFGSKTWNFIWTAPATRVGKIRFYVAGNAANSDGGPAGDYIYTDSATSLSGSAIANFDGDTASDVSVFEPATGNWTSRNSGNGEITTAQFGTAGDIIAPGDYDGDGITDRAVFRPSTGTWFIERSSGGFFIANWGSTGDVPVPGDYDGDLKNDLAVWRPSDGIWYIFRSSDGGVDIRRFGLTGDKPVQGDFDGDAKTDFAIYRPSDGVWYIWRSTDLGFTIFPFGIGEDKPVPADYDGDGRVDPAVYRPSQGFWYLLRSSEGYTGGPFGIATDVPVPADYDGDGRADLGVFRNGTWFILRSTDLDVTIDTLGTVGDVPVPAGYIPN